jgi:hypothetical protein
MVHILMYVILLCTSIVLVSSQSSWPSTVGPLQIASKEGTLDCSVAEPVYFAFSNVDMNCADKGFMRNIASNTVENTKCPGYAGNDDNTPTGPVADWVTTAKWYCYSCPAGSRFGGSTSQDGTQCTACNPNTWSAKNSYDCTVCPDNTHTLNGSPGTSEKSCLPSKKVKVSVRAFIPSPAVFLQGIPGVGIDIVAFSGDNRTFCPNCGTARVGVSNTFYINKDNTFSFDDWPGKQEHTVSHRYDRSTVTHVPNKPSWWGKLSAPKKCTNTPLGINAVLRCDGEFAPTMDNLYADGSDIDNTVYLHINAGIPLFKISAAPNIKLDATVKLTTSRGVTSWKIEGYHTTFPAFEIYLNDTAIYTYDPVANNASPAGLFISRYRVDKRGIIKDSTSNYKFNNRKMLGNVTSIKHNVIEQ